jgi:hypothetical protein
LHVRGQTTEKLHAEIFPQSQESHLRSTNFPAESRYNFAFIHHFLPLSCSNPKFLDSVSQNTKLRHDYERGITIHTVDDDDDDNNNNNNNNNHARRE